jgi:mitosis inhibitor protein kinase SWE1
MSASLAAISSPKIPLTKLFSHDTASPVSGRRTPQTPQEIGLPVDSSRLSISQAHGERSFAETSMPPPVTPTTVRDFRSSTSSFVTPVNDRTTNLDIDSSLYARFDKVEKIGKGEFSTVYRVVKNDPAFDAFDVLAASTPGQSSLSPTKGQVFAVKKSRHPFQGNRDREIKLREARILQALSHAEHVVHYVNDWEHQLHLYIQTEYCEEGHLKKFLYDVGFERRLDDFRIFKILQDLCLVSAGRGEGFMTRLTQVLGPQGNSRRRIHAP